jgi:hypothetical protein
MPKPQLIVLPPRGGEIPDRCPLGCGAKRWMIGEGVVYFRCGTEGRYVRERAKVRMSGACMRTVRFTHRREVYVLGGEAERG